MSEQNIVANITRKSLAATGAVVAANTASSLILPAIGFSQGGVVAGSIAATVHSTIGTVAAGSVFAGCQSLGALGLGVLGSATIPVALTTGAVVGIVAIVRSFFG